MAGRLAGFGARGEGEAAAVGGVRAQRKRGAGEAEAIVLAREIGDALVLMDERMGRAAAIRLGLRVTGLVGVLIEARERGLLADAEAVLEALHQRAGFWLSEELRRMVTGP